jgi:hypothetical protein
MSVGLSGTFLFSVSSPSTFRERHGKGQRVRVVVVIPARGMVDGDAAARMVAPLEKAEFANELPMLEELHPLLKQQ